MLSKRRVEKKKEMKKSTKKDDNTIKVFFDPGHYTVMENVGQFAVTVSREGDLNHSICVDFKTEDGTANAGSDYEAVEGTLIFRSSEAHKQVNCDGCFVCNKKLSFFFSISNQSNQCLDLYNRY